ncbi:hypothetical protein KO02_07390 [Sphingobacterium sp. ML3W]|uniref:DUF4377 domain-containing protein n=1 Tax=Sphingobacterium sp. ML3W TaxID=1538644 RepID=UPI0004F60F5B|nr:DUF4377 domain-containing protein [Sphingobacterium sp. ML3W]AIM36544.1 hypothetical protein KO02_07390 [Sphingobacterium sp. ML3W]
MIKFSALLFLSLTTISLTSLAQTNDVTIKLKSGIPQEKALQVKYYNSKDWEPFYARIDSFEYDPNYNYELRLRRTKLADPVPNKPSYRYTLLKTLHKSQSAGENLTMEINDKRVDCQGVGQMKCLQVKYSPKDDWEYFYSHIEGFEYEEGYTYTIIVNRTRVENPPQDASAYQYELVKIVAKTAAKNEQSLPTAAAFLSRHKWKLISLNGKEVAKYNAFLLFDADKGQISGNSSCNNFFGPFMINSNTIAFPNLGTTMRACMGENIEADLYKILENKELHYDIAEQTFNLYIKNEHVAIFGLTEK